MDSKTTDKKILHNREQFKSKLIELMKEWKNQGLPLNTFQQHYSTRYRTTVSKKDLGVKKLEVIFKIFDDDFVVKGDKVYYKKYDPNASDSQSSGPSWGSGARSKDLVPTSSEDSDSDVEITGSNVSQSRQGAGGNYLSLNVPQNSGAGSMGYLQQQAMVFANRNMQGEIFYVCLK